MTRPPRLSALRDAASTLHIEGARGLLLLGLLIAILLPQWLGGTVLRFTLRYDRAAVAAGEWWRLVSGHFVHLDNWHAVANAAGAVLIWALVAPAFGVQRWLVVIAVSIVGTSAGLWWGSRDLLWYVGASGMLHGLLAAGALRLALQADPLARVVLAILLVKLGWESLAGPLSEVNDGAGAARVVTAAHLYGALSGAAAVGLGAVVRAVGRRERPAT